MSLFDLPKRAAGYVEQPLEPALATRLLAQYGAQFDQDERHVFFSIERGLALNPQQRETLNGVFSKLGPSQ